MNNVWGKNCIIFTLAPILSHLSHFHIIPLGLTSSHPLSCSTASMSCHNFSSLSRLIILPLRNWQALLTSHAPWLHINPSGPHFIISHSIKPSGPIYLIDHTQVGLVDRISPNAIIPTGHVKLHFISRSAITSSHSHHHVTNYQSTKQNPLYIIIPINPLCTSSHHLRTNHYLQYTVKELLHK